MTTVMIEHGFDVESINEVRETTGLLLHSMYVGGNVLRLCRINHIHVIVTMPTIAYNAVFSQPINEVERKALIATVIELIERGEYDLARPQDDEHIMTYFANEIMRRRPNTVVNMRYTATAVTITIPGMEHTFQKRELFVRDTIALKHVLDTLGIKHAVLP